MIIYNSFSYFKLDLFVLPSWLQTKTLFGLLLNLLNLSEGKTSPFQNHNPIDGVTNNIDDINRPKRYFYLLSLDSNFAAFQYHSCYLTPIRLK